MSIQITRGSGLPIASQPVEFVERKGIGHPDSLIDGIVENVSLRLCDEYIENAGFILHHNVDKGLIVGGASNVRFGGGEITRPIEVIVAGRAAQSFQGKSIDVDKIAKRAAMDYLLAKTRNLDVNREVIFSTKIQKGSDGLEAVFSRGTDVPLSNDTSFGVGFAPYSTTEQITLEIERFLNGAEFKSKMPSVGEDIKVMSIREGKRIIITIAIAFVAQHVKSMDDYISQKDRVKKEVENLSKKMTDMEVEISINNADVHELNDAYITKSGLSCEAGDDGSVGRGNRVNGLITPFRSMSLEAAAGKNPVSHVGKIYNILSREIASDIVKLYPQVIECNVSMVSQIGRRIDQPKSMQIEAYMEEGKSIDAISNKIKDIAEETVGNVAFITKELSQGRYEMF